MHTHLDCISQSNLWLLIHIPHPNARVNIKTYILMHIHIHSCLYAYKHRCIYTYMYTYIHTYINIIIHEYITHLDYINQSNFWLSIHIPHPNARVNIKIGYHPHNNFQVHIFCEYTYKFIYINKYLRNI
jgi:hypothetical protein